MIPTPTAAAARGPRAGRILLLVALAATLAVPLLLGGGATFAAALQLSAGGYLALFAVVATSWVARTWKLGLLLRRLGAPIGYTRLFGISLAADFAFLATPGGIGGYAASVYYLRRAGASTSAAATVTAADQGLDLLFFALALPLAGGALAGSARLPAAWSILAVVAGVGMLALGLLGWFARRRLATWLFEANAITARRPWLLRRQYALRDFCRHLHGHLRLLADGGPVLLAGTFVLTALQWLTRYGVLWLALALLGHRVPFALTLAVQSLVLHAAQWTGMPAGGGGAELGLAATLAAWAPAADLATALLLWRMATLYLGLGAGALAIAALAQGTGSRRTVSFHNAHSVTDDTRAAALAAEPAADGG